MKPKFSTQLVKLRKEQGMSQDELAEKLFITRQAISK
ncbi:helix-turn-helix transcriptional regulator [Streptococcus hongkongensis]